MLINNETVADGLQYLNDVVGVFTDDHAFSETELVKFDFLTISGTVQEVRQRLEQITPSIHDAHLWATDNKYHWDFPANEDDLLDSIEVFQTEGSTKWYRLDNDFQFPVNVGDLSPEEKQLMETVDINHPSVDSFIRKLVKDINALSGNDVEIKDLRNSQP